MRMWPVLTAQPKTSMRREEVFYIRDSSVNIGTIDPLYFLIPY